MCILDSFTVDHFVGHMRVIVEECGPVLMIDADFVFSKDEKLNEAVSAVTS